MKTILVLLALTFTFQAKADTSDRAMQAAIDARNEFVSALIHKDYVRVTHDGFQHAIEALIEELIKRNDTELASELQIRWNESQNLFFSLGFTDLGDHAPLFAWLEDFFTKMSDKYGSLILKLPVVQDIRTLNFAIPVVFNPKGHWQAANVDNRIEYRKHFIPFANLITYYAADFGCNYIAQKEGLGNLKQLCAKAADKLRFVMGRYLAPAISDWIFKASNRQINVGHDQLRYENAEELRRAIRQ